LMTAVREGKERGRKATFADRVREKKGGTVRDERSGSKKKKKTSTKSEGEERRKPARCRERIREKRGKGCISCTPPCRR